MRDELAERLINALDQSDHTSRILTNATLQLVARVNDFGNNLAGFRAVGQEQARAVGDIAAQLETTLPRVVADLMAQAQRLDEHGKKLVEVEKIARGMKANADVGHRRGVAAAVHELRGALKSFSELPRLAQMLVWLLAFAAIVGWVLRGVETTK